MPNPASISLAEIALAKNLNLTFERHALEQIESG
jgi:hypothetical protein